MKLSEMRWPVMAWRFLWCASNATWPKSFLFFNCYAHGPVNSLEAKWKTVNWTQRQGVEMQAEREVRRWHSWWWHSFSSSFFLVVQINTVFLKFLESHPSTHDCGVVGVFFAWTKYGGLRIRSHSSYISRWRGGRRSVLTRIVIQRRCIKLTKTSRIKAVRLLVLSYFCFHIYSFLSGSVYNL